MRWLIASRQHHPSHGGIGTYVHRFCHAAKSLGWHVELITQPGDDWPPCARVHELTTADMQPDFDPRLPDLRRRHVVRPYRYALWSKAVAEKLLAIDGRFDAIEFVDCQAEGFVSIGCQAVRERHCDAKFIVHAHTPMWFEESINGSDASSFGRTIYHDWERRAIANADAVIVTAGVLRDAIESVAASTVIPYPIQEDRSSTLQPRQQRIVLIGSVQPRKGVDVWARSLNQVLKAKPRATAMLIGPDTSTAPDGLSMAAHVQRLIDPRVIDRFRWLGSMPHDQVRDVIATSALVAVPSRLESFSFVAAEALLAGTPVIVSNRTGIAEHAPSLPVAASEDCGAWAAAQIEMLSAMERSAEQALRCRDEMLAACSPRRVLTMREQLLANAANRDQATGGIAEGDALSEVAAFIESVDAPSLASSEAS